MKRRPDPYPDLIPRAQIQAYLYKRTGTLVTQARIGRWIANGEIRLIQRPRRAGGGTLTRKLWLDELVRRYSV